MRFLKSLEWHERPALIISQMFLPEEIDELIALVLTSSGWRLGDLLPRNGTRRSYFLALAQELLTDPGLAAEFVRLAASVRPRRHADCLLLAELLGAPRPPQIERRPAHLAPDRGASNEPCEDCGGAPTDDADGIRGDAAGDPLADVCQPGNTESYNFGRLTAKLDAPRAVCVDLVLSAAWWALRDLGDPALTAAMGRMVVRYRGARGAIIVGGEGW